VLRVGGAEAGGETVKTKLNAVWEKGVFAPGGWRIKYAGNELKLYETGVIMFDHVRPGVEVMT